MSFLNSLFIGIINKKVGADSFGNRYYEGRSADYLGRKKRYVVYKGLYEPSKVPPLWHAWLHYLSDEVPAGQISFSWQQEHLPNLTGTKLAYNPAKPKNNNTKKTSAEYCRWQPK